MASLKSTLKSTRRQPKFESLEKRQMLAGDVFVNVVDGNLIVKGDELDNQIAITSGPEPGSYVVRGLDGTHVHRAAGDGGEGPEHIRPGNEVVVNGVRRGAKITMGDGNDLVAINKAHFRGSVAIGMGAGNDRVVVGVPRDQPTDPVSAETDGADGMEDPMREGPSVQIGRSLLIRTGEGEDHVRVGSAAIRSNLGILTGADNDTVLLGRPALAGPNEPGDLDDGGDNLAASDDQQEEMERPHATLRVGHRVRVGLGEGNDNLATGQLRARGIAVNGGAGEDSIRLNQTASRSLAINGGLGDATDNVSLNQVRAGRALINTGGGNDHVRITDSAFRMLGVALGDGNDSLAIGGTAARVAMLFGGEGEDLYRDLGENRFHRHVIQGFELPPLDDNDDDNSVA